MLGSRCLLEKLSKLVHILTITTEMAIFLTEIAVFLTEIDILITKNPKFLTKTSHITSNIQKSIRKSPLRDSPMLFEMVLLNNA